MCHLNGQKRCVLSSISIPIHNFPILYVYAPLIRCVDTALILCQRLHVDIQCTRMGQRRRTKYHGIASFCFVAVLSLIEPYKYAHNFHLFKISGSVVTFKFNSIQHELLTENNNSFVLKLRCFIYPSTKC